MKIPPVKGTRDFYPAEMSVRNWITDGWKAASVRNGFEEYDGPIFEYLQMFQIKSGDEIAEQLFSLQDRGGRDLAIRPEITPTLARMVNQKVNSLSKPIRWFSVPRLCRAERPQKGRLREFFQWNVDIIGLDDVAADAEVIFCALDYLQQTGLTADDIVVKISSRKMLAAVLKAIGIAENMLDKVYALLDKRNKLPEETFEKMLCELIDDDKLRIQLIDLMNAKSIEDIETIAGGCDRVKDSVEELGRLFELLQAMEVGDFCKFDIGIVRGLAYYTGIVFEIYDKASELRAICGGGRYDDLLKQFGGPAISATGFGMGDCVLGILLEEKGLIHESELKQKTDYFVIYANTEFYNDAIGLVAKLRRKGKITSFCSKAANMGKQLKQASTQEADKCIIVGQELREGNEIVIKDMSNGEQEKVNIDKFLEAF